jgi:hypothetical protein
MNLKRFVLGALAAAKGRPLEGVSSTDPRSFGGHSSVGVD